MAAAHAEGDASQPPQAARPLNTRAYNRYFKMILSMLPPEGTGADCSRMSLVSKRLGRHADNSHAALSACRHSLLCPDGSFWRPQCLHQNQLHLKSRFSHLKRLTGFTRAKHRKAPSLLPATARSPWAHGAASRVAHIAVGNQLLTLSRARLLFL